MRAAQLLGFKDQGTTQVQVEILPEESRSLKEEILARQNDGKKGSVRQASDASSQNDVVIQPPPRPQNLTPSSANYPQSANAPAAGVSGALISADASVGVSARSADYNAWDADRPQSAAQKEYRTEKNVLKQAPQPEKTVPAAKSVPVSAGKTSKSAIGQKVKSVVSVSSFPAGYYVQVGAFSSKENADKMARRVSSFGKATVSPVDVRGKTLYRVRLGPDDAQKAVEIMDNVTAAGIAGARLVEEKKVSSPAPVHSAVSRRAATYRSEDEF